MKNEVNFFKFGLICIFIACLMLLVMQIRKMDFSSSIRKAETVAIESQDKPKEGIAKRSWNWLMGK